jgi:S-(hydroxymethyl)glutathione dehydrogenase/alcohol dehydrogenase
MIEVNAAVGDGQGNFTVEPVHLGAPGQGEVLIAMRASGVCHTDWDSLLWRRPVILGHEGAGEVLRVGDGVTNCQPGDRVMLNWAIPCSVCFQCQRGKENICENRGTVPDSRYRRTAKNAQRQDLISANGTNVRNTGGAGEGSFNASFSLGTMATHALVPQAAVLPLPDDVPFEIGAILGCAVMTGFGSAVNAAQVASGSTVVVLGCGGVGLSAILGALYCGAARVIGVDVNPARLELAEQFGATETLLADRSDKGLLKAAREIRQRNGGRGADYAFECTAVPELGSAPLAVVRNAGTAVGVSGIEQVVTIDMELFEWDKKYVNPLYGACRPQRDFPLLLDLYRQGKLPLDAMVTRRYPLEGLREAFHHMHAGVNAKGVLIF